MKHCLLLLLLLYHLPLTLLHFIKTSKRFGMIFIILKRLENSWKWFSIVLQLNQNHESNHSWRFTVFTQHHQHFILALLWTFLPYKYTFSSWFYTLTHLALTVFHRAAVCIRRCLKWSRAPRPKISATTSPDVFCSNPPKASVSLWRLPTRWRPQYLLSTKYRLSNFGHHKIQSTSESPGKKYDSYRISFS